MDLSGPQRRPLKGTFSSIFPRGCLRKAVSTQGHQVVEDSKEAAIVSKKVHLRKVATLKVLDNREWIVALVMIRKVMTLSTLDSKQWALEMVITTNLQAKKVFVPTADFEVNIILDIVNEIEYASFVHSGDTLGGLSLSRTN